MARELKTVPMTEYKIATGDLKDEIKHAINERDKEHEKVSSLEFQLQAANAKNSCLLNAIKNLASALGDGENEYNLVMRYSTDNTKKDTASWERA